MFTVKEILGKLEDRNLTTVATRINIPYQSLLYFVNHKGETRVDMIMIEKLSDYLECEHKKEEQGIIR